MQTTSMCYIHSPQLNHIKLSTLESFDISLGIMTKSFALLGTNDAVIMKIEGGVSNCAKRYLLFFSNPYS